MERSVGSVPVHLVEHGSGTAVLVLHGAGVDHREAEACFEPALREHALRRIYPDLPGMGRTPAPDSLQSADDVLEVLLGLVDDLVGDRPLVLVGHSSGAYYAEGIAARRSHQVLGTALVCPLLPDTRDVPAHRPIAAIDGLGDQAFRDYFVVQDLETLDRYERLVAPALPLVDDEAMARIGERWQLALPADSFLPGATLVVAGRQDSTVGSAAAVDLAQRTWGATLAVLDGAGHALPHEQPALLAALLHDWLSRALRGVW